MRTKPFSQDSDSPVIAARLERETYESLKAMAAEQRRPLGSLIRIICEDFVKDQGGMKHIGPVANGIVRKIIARR